MPEQHLRETLEHLDELLTDPDALDAEDREHLRRIGQKVQNVLDEDHPAQVEDDPTFADELREGVRRFELTHPGLTAALNRLVDVLNRMGI